jgi:hypothetical protein
MTVLRTDIECALDEFISNEEGMRFQSLAVELAKQKWRQIKQHAPGRAGASIRDSAASHKANGKRVGEGQKLIRLAS